MFRSFTKSSFIKILVFAICVWTDICDSSQLKGILTSSPELVEDGTEVRISCKYYLNDEHQNISIAMTIAPGEGSPNINKPIATYNNATSKYQEKDGRWVAVHGTSFTARTEDHPVKVECFYTLHQDITSREIDLTAMIENFITMVIKILEHPTIEEKRDCDDQPIETCVLYCRFRHQNIIKVSPGSCQWRYRASANAPSIVIASNSHIHTQIDGTSDAMSLDLSGRGAFAGEYVCHIDYNIAGTREILKTYPLNGILEAVSRTDQKSDLNGPCTSQKQCKTYQATCVRDAESDKGTCQCVGQHPNIYSQTVDDQEYILSCYGKERPIKANLEQPEGLLDKPFVVAALVAVGIAAGILLLYILVVQAYRESQPRPHSE